MVMDVVPRRNFVFHTLMPSQLQRVSFYTNTNTNTNANANPFSANPNTYTNPNAHVNTNANSNSNANTNTNLSPITPLNSQLHPHHNANATLSTEQRSRSHTSFETDINSVNEPTRTSDPSPMPRRFSLRMGLSSAIRSRLRSLRVTLTSARSTVWGDGDTSLQTQWGHQTNASEDVERINTLSLVKELLAIDPAAQVSSPWDPSPFIPLSHRQNFQRLMQSLLSGDRLPMDHQLAGLSLLADFMESNSSFLEIFYDLDGLSLLLMIGSSSSVLIQTQAARIALLLIEEECMQEFLIGEAGMGMLCTWASSPLPHLRYMGSYCMIPVGTLYLESPKPQYDACLVFHPIAQLLLPEIPILVKRSALEAICQLSQCEEMKIAMAYPDNFRNLIRECSSCNQELLSYVCEILTYCTEDGQCALMFIESPEFCSCINIIATSTHDSVVACFPNLISNLLFNEEISVSFAKRGGLQALIAFGNTVSQASTIFSISTISLLVSMKNYCCADCGLRPITNLRYRCLSCEDYNLCAECFHKQNMSYNESHTRIHNVVEEAIGTTIEDELLDDGLLVLVISNCQCDVYQLSWNCVNILYRLSHYGEISRRIVALGGLEVLNHLTVHVSPFLRQIARMTICAIVSQDSCHEILVSQGSWKKLLPILCTNDVSSQAKAIHALARILPKLQDAAANILRSGALEYIIPLVYCKDPSLQASSAKCLSDLSGFRTLDDAAYFADKGGYNAAIYLLESDSELQTMATLILLNICRFQKQSLLSRGLLQELPRIQLTQPDAVLHMSRIFHILSKDASCMAIISQDRQLLESMCRYGESLPTSHFNILSGFHNIVASGSACLYNLGELYSFLKHVVEQYEKQEVHIQVPVGSIVCCRLVVKILLSLSKDVGCQRNMAMQGFVECLVNLITNQDKETALSAAECLKSMCCMGGPLSTSWYLTALQDESQAKDDDKQNLCIKCDHEGQIYNLLLELPPRFEVMRHEISDHYGFDPRMEYYDEEGDLVCIFNQEDLEEAIRTSREVLHHDMLWLSIRPKIDQKPKEPDSCPSSVITLSYFEASSTARSSTTTSASGELFDNSLVLSFDDDAPGGKSPHTKEKFVLNEAQLSQIAQGDLISRGPYSEVYKGTWRGVDVAIKKILLSQTKEGCPAEFLREAQTLRQLRHSNIVTYLGASYWNDHLYIITEFMPRGSLYRLIHDTKTELSYQLRLQMAYDAARGMRHLHNLKPIVVHRDLKSPNLLVGEDWNVKVADFGLSKTKIHDCVQSDIVGTVEWMAPEVLRGDDYNETVDVYSFGVILWELLTRQKPYRHQHRIQIVLDVVSRNLRPTIPVETSPDMTDLIKRCWERNPQSRPSFSSIVEVLKHMNGVVETIQGFDRD